MLATCVHKFVLEFWYLAYEANMHKASDTPNARL